ncbi:MAG: hypothetical protein JWR63_3174 [Conexibacter sp.]|nr:hypothetical protein [Conexibacter sp.]
MCAWPSLKAARIDFSSSVLTPSSADCRFITELKPAWAIESKAMSLAPYFWIAASMTFASSLPLSSDWNGWAKYSPSAESPAALSAGGDVHGSIPRIFAVLPTALSAFSSAGHALGELTYTTSGELAIAAAATEERSAALGATGIALTSVPAALNAGAITPRPVALPCESSV